MSAKFAGARVYVKHVLFVQSSGIAVSAISKLRLETLDAVGLAARSIKQGLASIDGLDHVTMTIGSSALRSGCWIGHEAREMRLFCVFKPLVVMDIY